MTDKRSLVSIVDDDESVRESLPELLRLSGFAAALRLLTRPNCVPSEIATHHSRRANERPWHWSSLAC